jgi:transketolase
MAETNPDIVVVSQDMGTFGSFSARFPDRFFDLGISEANLIGVAAGLAHAGKLPFVVAMAPFVSMRSFEQIRTDCGYNRNNVKIIAHPPRGRRSRAAPDGSGHDRSVSG